MDIRRTIGLAALSAAVAALALAPGARAQQAESYSARSSGTTFELSVLGQGGIGGRSEATIASTGRAAANAAAFEILGVPFGASSADTAQGQSGSPEPACEIGFDDIPFLQFGLACSQAVASGGGTPSATASTVIGEGGGNYAPFLDTEISQFIGPLQQGADELLSALEAVTGPIDEQGFNLGGTLEELFGSLFEGADLLRITAGDTVVETKVTDGTITSTCAADGIRVDVLKGETSGPVLSVLIGQASTEVVAPLDGSAAPTTTANPAPVRVESPLLPGGAFFVPGFQRVELSLGDPFGTVVVSGGGWKTGVDEAGATYALVEAANLELFTGFEAGIKLAAVGCESAVSASVARTSPAMQAPEQATMQPPGTPEAARTLLRTGGSTNPLAASATFRLAELGDAIVRRASPRTWVPQHHLCGPATQRRSSVTCGRP
jgi:hypothetical protein